MSGLPSSIRVVCAVSLVTVSAACATAAHGAPAGQDRTKASVSTYPVVYLGGMAGGWMGPSVRPRTLYLGADWTISGLRWADWGQQEASGHGTYDACAGAAGPCDRFWAAITVTDVRTHHGTRYFAAMKVTGTGQPTDWLVMDMFGVWQRR
jgi:hypothetical protein